MVNWKQAFATAGALFGMMFAVFGGYLTVRSWDKDYDTSVALERNKLEKIMELKKSNAEEYKKQMGSVRTQIITIEAKIEKIDPEKIKKDEKSGVLLSGENLILSKEINQGLEDLNKEMFRQPEGLASAINGARTELFNRFQSKVFDKHFSDQRNKFEANPFYIRQFDASTEGHLKLMFNEK